MPVSHFDSIQDTIDLKLMNKHFFSPNAMRSFNSRISSNIWRLWNDEKQDHEYVFITSERFQNESRLYTIRKMNRTGDISDVSEFGQYRSLNGAKAAVNRIAGIQSRWSY